MTKNRQNIFTKPQLQQFKAAIILLLLSVPVSPANADICFHSAIDVTVENMPSNMIADDEYKLFDGISVYSADAAMEIREPNAPGEEAFVFKMGMVLLANTTFEFFYEVDDADGQSAQDFADALNKNGYGAWYWDYDNSGILDGADFDLDGNGTTNAGTGDYSPLGFIVQLFNGDPGNPIGSGPGTLVHTANSPIQPIEKIAYSFTVTAPAEFDYLVIESTPDGAGQNPRIIEIRHNENSNFVQGLSHGSSVNCGLSAHNYL